MQGLQQFPFHLLTSKPNSANFLQPLMVNQKMSLKRLIIPGHLYTYDVPKKGWKNITEEKNVYIYLLSHILQMMQKLCT